jgi:hypothetical protein
MQLNRLLAFIVAVASTAALLTSAMAQQTGSFRPGPTAQQRSNMSGLMKPRFGQIIGNKNTKVYHLPGDKGSLPSEKNRVYFRTEREAIAAGYHHTKTGGKSKMTKPMNTSMGQMKPGMGTMKPGLPK